MQCMNCMYKMHQAITNTGFMWDARFFVVKLQGFMGNRHLAVTN